MGNILLLFILQGSGHDVGKKNIFADFNVYNASMKHF